MLDGITCITICLNDEQDIGSMLDTIKKNNPDQLIVVDGGSSDRTVEIAKRYTNDVYISQKGISNQYKLGLSKVKYKYLLDIECDHRYPENFVSNLLSEFRNSNFFGLQASLVCQLERTFLEKGFSQFYKIHQISKGKKDVIGGPSMYLSDEYIKIFTMVNAQGYSSDTTKGEVLKKLGLKVGLGYTEAYQYEEFPLNKFLHKYFNYGKGDYDFYIQHKKNWSFKRKLKSITHVFNRYIIDYPLKAIKMGKVLYVPYFWLSAVPRYAGWIYTIIKGK